MTQISPDPTQSRIPGPVSKYGYPYSPPIVKVVLYDGDDRNIPSFLLQHGGSPTQWKPFLLANRIGSPFVDLQNGIQVGIPGQVNTFPTHPEA